jgi:hypothetical protein
VVTQITMDQFISASFWHEVWVAGSDCCISGEGEAPLQSLVQVKSLTACNLRYGTNGSPC